MLGVVVDLFDLRLGTVLAQTCRVRCFKGLSHPFLLYLLLLYCFEGRLVSELVSLQGGLHKGIGELLALLLRTLEERACGLACLLNALAEQTPKLYWRLSIAVALDLFNHAL